MAANLIVKILDKVPFGSRFGLKAVLFFLTIEKTRSWAFECGIASTSFATVANLENLKQLLASFM